MSVLDQWRITEEPYYAPQGDEIALFEAAYAARLPVMVKGPTGCGKSRFIEHAAWKLGRPLVTVACNEDMTAADLVGRFLLEPGGTRWQDGPLTMAARHGAICYLDEIVEARQDTTVVIHPLTDYRRTLPLDKKGELIRAHPDFQLVISYNPGYQNLMKDLKTSTRQRFVALDFDYPTATLEAEIVVRETGIAERSGQRVWYRWPRRRVGSRATDSTKESRRVFWSTPAISCARALRLRDACRMAMVRPITDDAEIRETLEHTIDAVLV
jgi:nitric oxide reductase NorQ protein